MSESVAWFFRLEILEFGGIGHTLALHATADRVIEQFAIKKPSMRIVVNTVAALGSVGMTTRLFPAMTLGPGTVGGSITSDNVSPLHLINVKRVAFETGNGAAAPAAVAALPLSAIAAVAKAAAASRGGAGASGGAGGSGAGPEQELAAATLHLFMAATGRRVPWGRQAWLAFAGMGVLNNVVPFSLIDSCSTVPEQGGS